MTNENKPSTSYAFGIALFIAAIIFVIIFFNLRFPHNYELGGKILFLGISIAIGGVIFAIAAGVINAIFKAFVEICVVILLFFNVSYVVYSWLFFNKVSSFVEEYNFDINSTILAVILIIFVLLIVNLFWVFILLPMARIAGTDVLDG